MTRFVAGLLTLWMTLAGAAQAQQAVVVELFTSQGCSSCPPADKLLHQMAGRDDVIPLALHVDYWDYIGWKDEFAQAAFTERQKAYARVSGRRVIYTPQMVINGQHDVVGNRPRDVEELIAKHAAKPVQVDLDVTRSGGQVLVKAQAMTQIAPADLVIVRFQDKAVVNIKRGENAGRKLTYSHIVRAWTPVARWNGRGALEKAVDVEGDDPIAVLIQGRDHGPVFAAVRLR